MNRKAKELQLTKTVFANPHGLANLLNVSSAKDILTLCKYAYNNELFREVSNTKIYSSSLY
jgi:D-alanyl-D-alanine carboxypeptidase (penicillin-binding protein 5/6)